MSSRQNIATAMAELLPRYGYRGTSIKRLANHADLRPGLVHYYYKSKADILAVVIEQAAEQLHERIDQAVDCSASQDVQLDQWIDATLGLHRPPASASMATWCTVVAEAPAHPEIVSLVNDALATLQQSLEQVLGPLVADSDLQHASASILSLVHGYWLLGRPAHSVIPTGSAAPAAKRLARSWFS